MVHVANRLKSMGVLAWMAAGAVATLLVAATMVLAPREAAATAAYGQQTGMACGQCHVKPAGGGKLTTFGMNWQAKGHQLPGK